MLLEVLHFFVSFLADHFIWNWRKNAGHIAPHKTDFRKPKVKKSDSGKVSRRAFRRGLGRYSVFATSTWLWSNRAVENRSSKGGGR